MENSDLDADAEPFGKTPSGAGEAVQLSAPTSAVFKKLSETDTQDPPQSAIPGLQQSSLLGGHQQAPATSQATQPGPQGQIADAAFPAVQQASSPSSWSQDEVELQRDVLKGVNPISLDKFCGKHSSQSPSSEPSPFEKIKNLSIESRPTEEIRDEDIEQYRLSFPDSLKLDYYDAMILYHKKDREAVEKFVKRVETDVTLDKIHKPRVVLFDEIMPNCGMMPTGQLDFSLPYCTYVLLYVTKDFCSDEGWSRFSSQTCLMEAINNPRRRWTVVPIFTESKRKNAFNAPPSIRSLKGIQYLSDDKFHVDSMRKLLEDKLDIRLEKEKEHRSKRKIEIIKIRGENKRAAARRHQEVMQAEEAERVRMEQFKLEQSRHPIKIQTPQEAMKNLCSQGPLPLMEHRQESQKYMNYLESQFAERPVNSQSVPVNTNYFHSPPFHPSLTPDHCYHPGYIEKSASLTGLNTSNFPPPFPKPDQAKPQFTLGDEGSRFSEVVSPPPQQPPWGNSGMLSSQQHPYPGGDKYFQGNACALYGMTAGNGGHRSMPGPGGHQSMPGPGGHQSMPGAGGHQSMPGPGGHQSMPGPGGHQSMPGAGGHQSMPGPEGHQSMPGAGGHQSMPGTGGHQSMPGPGGHQSMPGAGGHQSMPGAGGHQSMPGPGGHQSMPQLGGSRGQGDRAYSSLPPMVTTTQLPFTGSVVANHSIPTVTRASQQSSSFSASSFAKEPQNMADSSREHQSQLTLPGNQEWEDGDTQQLGRELPQNVTEDLPPESQFCQGQSHLGPSPNRVTKYHHVGQVYISEAVSQPPLKVQGPGHHSSARSRAEPLRNQDNQESTVNPNSGRAVASTQQSPQYCPPRYQYAPQPGQRGPEDYWHPRYGPYPQDPYHQYSPYLQEHLHQPYDPHVHNFQGGKFYNSSQMYSPPGNPPYHGYMGQGHYPYWQQQLPPPPPPPQPPHQQLSQPGYPEYDPEYQQPKVVHYHYYNQGEKVPTTTVNNINIGSTDQVIVANKIDFRKESHLAGVRRNKNQVYPSVDEAAPAYEERGEGESIGEMAAAGAAASFGSQHSGQNTPSRLTDAVTGDLRSQQSSECRTSETQPSQLGFRDLPTMSEPPDSQMNPLSSFHGLAQGGQQLEQRCRDYDREHETELKKFVAGPSQPASFERSENKDGDETTLKYQGSS